MRRIGPVRRGFTLIETLVALAVAIAVLGAGVGATRSVHVLNQVNRNQAAMISIARDSVRLLEMIGNAAPSYSSVFLPGNTGYGIVVVDGTVPGTKEESGDVLWCSEERIADPADTACSSYRPRVSIGAADELDEVFSYVGRAELVAIGKPQGAFTTNPPTRYRWFDNSSFVTPNGNGLEILYADGPSAPSYSFYRREVRIQPASTMAFNGDQTGADVEEPALSDLRSRTYIVSVKVESLADRTASYELRTTLTDTR